MLAIKSAIRKLTNKRDLEEKEAEKVMKNIMSGEATPAQIGAFLSTLRMKGETPSEIAALARVMRKFATSLDPNVDEKLVDTCGTGGDRLDTFNISTTSMFISAGAGVKIAKHGNRSVTSKSGSADVLETLGVKIDLPPEKVEENIEELGLGFMFAPKFHGAMKHAIGPRKEIGLRTVFNVLGPLTNPANAPIQLMGVYDESLTEKLAKVLKKLNSKRAMVVHGLDGLDEISTVGNTKISELNRGEIHTHTVKPEDFGIERSNPKYIEGGDATKNARLMIKILKGEEGPPRDITMLNSAATIYLHGKADSIEEGLERAKKSIESGNAYQKLEELVISTGGELKKLKELEESI